VGGYGNDTGNPYLKKPAKLTYILPRLYIENPLTNPRRRTMPKAVWNSTVLAESDNCEVVEGNYYFPPDSIKSDYFKPSDTHTTCPWKGVASYYSIEVDGQTNKDAAWYYPTPKDAAKNIKGYIAFWRGVKVEA
jgi:uncharacterized protein (DUF427 family)